MPTCHSRLLEESSLIVFFSAAGETADYETETARKVVFVLDESLMITWFHAISDIYHVGSTFDNNNNESCTSY